MAQTEEQKARRLRVFNQLKDWAEGKSIHNEIDDECCPDFSCCASKLLADEETRKAFFAAYKQKKYNITESMLFGFLGPLVEAKGDKEGKVFISDGKNEIIKDLN